MIDSIETAIPIHAVRKDGCADWLKTQDQYVQTWAATLGFVAKDGQTLMVPDAEGRMGVVVYGIGDDDTIDGPWMWASLYEALPKGTKGRDNKDRCFKLVGDFDEHQANDVALGFALASYRYDFYHSKKLAPDQDNDHQGPFLVWPDGVDQAYVRAAFGATKLARDLINTPASDLGPAELAKAAHELAVATGAKFKTIVGVDLIREGFPAIYAVGRGAEENRAPRLVDFTWGRTDAPKVTLVGKGVCFDTGGLDIKSTAGMKLMKKDMGGRQMFWLWPPW